MSIVKNGRKILSNVIDTQISIHEKFGGVVPEIASRNHVEAISTVMKKAVADANININDIDAIACTYGPGLVGALLVGVSYAKALSYALNKPLIAVNHIKGHIAANYITHEKLEPPFLCMMMSGGNTQIILVKDYNTFEVLGKTKDDAKIDKLAQQGKPNINLPKTHFDNLNFSFSGIKTAVINLNHNKPGINKADLAVSFEKTVAEILVNHIEEAVKITNINKIVLAGGVSANTYIRKSFDDFAIEKNLNIYYPELKLCTDNGAMIASAGYYEFVGGNTSNLELNAIPNLTLS